MQRDDSQFPISGSFPGYEGDILHTVVIRDMGVFQAMEASQDMAASQGMEVIQGSEDFQDMGKELSVQEITNEHIKKSLLLLYVTIFKNPV